MPTSVDLMKDTIPKPVGLGSAISVKPRLSSTCQVVVKFASSFRQATIVGLD